MSTWQLQDAQTRFKELVKSVDTEGPQKITVQGKPAAVVLSVRDYERLAGGGESHAASMRRSPIVDAPECTPDSGFGMLTSKLESVPVDFDVASLLRPK